MQEFLCLFLVNQTVAHEFARVRTRPRGVCGAPPEILGTREDFVAQGWSECPPLGGFLHDARGGGPAGTTSGFRMATFGAALVQ